MGFYFQKLTVNNFIYLKYFQLHQISKYFLLFFFEINININFWYGRRFVKSAKTSFGAQATVFASIFEPLSTCNWRRRTCRKLFFYLLQILDYLIPKFKIILNFCNISLLNINIITFSLIQLFIDFKQWEPHNGIILRQHRELQNIYSGCWYFQSVQCTIWWKMKGTRRNIHLEQAKFLIEIAPSNSFKIYLYSDCVVETSKLLWK